MPKPKLEATDLVIIFPAGTGGNFLVSMCYPDQFSKHNRKFNEYKMNYELLESSEHGKLGWFEADNKFALTASTNNTPATKPISKKIIFGHHLPVNTLALYELTTPKMLELVATNVQSRHIIRLLAKTKNDIFTDFNAKSFQIENLLTTILEYIQKSGYSVQEVLSRCSNVEMLKIIYELETLIKINRLNDNIVYTANSILMWRYAIHCVVNNEMDVSLANFNKFIGSSFNMFNGDPEHDLDLRYRAQRSIRKSLRLSYNLVSLEYSTLFFDLEIPSALLATIIPSKVSNAHKFIAAYSKRNLDICRQVNSAIQNADYEDSINTSTARLKAACDKLKLDFRTL